MITVLICIVGVILRFRRARGVERQQLKWFAYGMSLTVLLILAIGILIFTPWLAPSTLFYLTAIVCIPISAGIAILRYRLYDIDLLINLTLVYGLLSAVLLALYLALVFGGQHLVSSFLGPNNGLVLVCPRCSLQRFFSHCVCGCSGWWIDASIGVSIRGYRGSPLRGDATPGSEPGQLRTHLLAVIEDTVQPAHLSLWLMEAKSRNQLEPSSEKVPPQ